MINSMGDKITAKETMIKAGVPVVPGGEGLLADFNQGKNAGKRNWLPGDFKGDGRWWWQRYARCMGRS
jgi:acetyl/propionyl-CoA carboxylase alpha subunit